MTAPRRPRVPPPPPPPPVPLVQFQLHCAVCLSVHRGTSVDVADADTIVEGIAVCYDHLDNINSPKLSHAVQVARLSMVSTPPKSTP